MTDVLRHGTGLLTAGGRITDDTLQLVVPTRDLMTCLKDVAPFVSPEPDDIDHHCIKIEWDADDDRLHFTSSDGFRTAWSSWGPDDIPEYGDDEQLGVQWGPLAETETRSITINADDIADVLTSFKVGKKDGRTPVTVTVSEKALTVYRSGETGYSEHTLRIKATQSRPRDVRTYLAAAARNLTADTKPALSVAYTPSLFEAFTKVRPGSVLELTFASEKITLIRAGRYFRGSIAPAVPDAE